MSYETNFKHYLLLLLLLLNVKIENIYWLPLRKNASYKRPILTLLKKANFVTEKKIRGPSIIPNYSLTKISHHANSQ